MFEIIVLTICIVAVILAANGLWLLMAIALLAGLLVASGAEIIKGIRGED